MTIRFVCSSCQQPLRVKDGSSGRQLPCPKCGKILRVPECARKSDAPSDDATALRRLGLKDSAVRTGLSKNPGKDNADFQPVPLAGGLDTLFKPRDATAPCAQPPGPLVEPDAESQMDLPAGFPRIPPQDSDEWTPSQPDHHASRAEPESEEIVKEAVALSSAGELAQAIRLLEEIPDDARSPALRRTLIRLYEQQRTVTTLRKDIYNRVSAKKLSAEELRDLCKLMIGYLELQPNDAQVRILLDKVEQRQRQAEKKLWISIQQEGTMEDYRRYLQKFPGGVYAAEAQGLVAPYLRELLFSQPLDEALRNEYLSARTPVLEDEDLNRARLACVARGALFGAIGGVLVGIAIGAVTGAAGGAIGGLVGGVLLTVCCEQA